MMNTTDSGQGHYVSRFAQPWFNWPPLWRLLQADVGAIIVIIDQQFTPQPPEILLIDGNDVAEQVAATSPDPAARNSVLLRAARAWANGLYSAHLEKFQRLAAEFSVRSSRACR